MNKPIDQLTPFEAKLLRLLAEVCKKRFHESLDYCMPHPKEEGTNLLREYGFYHSVNDEEYGIEDWWDDKPLKILQEIESKQKPASS